MATYDDPRVLRAIAHPTRNRVLHALNARGAMRATDVAAVLDIPANQASFHLRQLAKYGLVEEAPDTDGDKRSRPWRVVDEDGITFSTRAMAAQPGGEAAVAVFKRRQAAHLMNLVASAVADTGDERHRTISEMTLLMDPTAVSEFNTELLDLVQRYGARGREHADDPAWTSWQVLTVVQPEPDES